MTLTRTEHLDLSLADIVGNAEPDARLDRCGPGDVARMKASAGTIASYLDAGRPIYGLTQGFGPLVLFEAESEMEQGHSLISHLGSGQGAPLSPQVCRLVGWLRLNSMRKGFSAVSPEFWQRLADLWNAGFTPAIPRDGTVSASGDLQPLAHAALAHTGFGEAWVRDADGGWRTKPADRVLTDLGATPFAWPVREALAFVNGTGVSLAATLLNQRSALTMVRAAAVLTGRIAAVLGANPEHYSEGIGVARSQAGQLVAAGWIRDELGAGHALSPERPLQEPYSLRCGPQVLGAALDQLDWAGESCAARRTAAPTTPSPSARRCCTAATSTRCRSGSRPTRSGSPCTPRPTSSSDSWR